jgi:tetrahydromethanopterin S-methyltransferase subunit A
MSDDTIAKEWPPVRGDYTVVDPQAQIFVATLASDMDLFHGACMVGSCKSENLGIEKIIINTISSEAEQDYFFILRIPNSHAFDNGS